MKVKLKNNLILEVRRIVGENINITTFENLDGELITFNNEEIRDISF